MTKHASFALTRYAKWVRSVFKSRLAIARGVISEAV